ncbi:hypothetical protein [Nocardia iowensis]|uniref:YbaB/EbfC family DNA-binding protein n=1 Tax=Nocardia iowensis TaxID=204891 RepID=A0ABX8RYG0_NOCIO|nr:hypothetical protein [Nocardia iowensis]QXN93395.1 hypothetical protein KV110_10080 [Nocardia iowensis]
MVIGDVRDLFSEEEDQVEALRARVRAAMAEIDGWTYEAGDGSAHVTVSADGRVLAIELPRGLTDCSLGFGGATEAAWSETSNALAETCRAIVAAVNSARRSAAEAAIDVLRKEFPEAFEHHPASL